MGTISSPPFKAKVSFFLKRTFPFNSLIQCHPSTPKNVPDTKQMSKLGSENRPPSLKINDTPKANKMAAIILPSVNAITQFLTSLSISICGAELLVLPPSTNSEK